MALFNDGTVDVCQLFRFCTSDDHLSRREDQGCWHGGQWCFGEREQGFILVLVWVRAVVVPVGLPCVATYKKHMGLLLMP